MRSVRNYEACSAPKKICLIEEATHAMSFLKDTDKYVAAMENFFEDF